MIGAARPCPVSIADQMPNTMIPQWHRGSAWAVAHARRFRDEVAERVAAGVGVSAERARAPDVDRRRASGTTRASTARSRSATARSSSGRCTCPSPARSTSASCTTGRCTRSRAASARMNEVLHLPPWMNGWMVSEAERCGIDAAVILVPPDNRLSQSGTQLTRRALERRRRPDADARRPTWSTPRSWDHERMVEHVGELPARRRSRYEGRRCRC